MPVAVIEVALVACELYKSTEPAPVDPSQSEYAVAPAVAVQPNATEEPVSTEPEIGAVSWLCPNIVAGRAHSKSRVIRMRQEIGGKYPAPRGFALLPDTLGKL